MTAQLGPIHHVAIVVRSIEESLPRYRELFGLEPEVAPFVFAAQRVRLCFLPTGPEPAARIELVEPIDDESGVARFLAARGEGVHHLCFVTDDLPRELEHLAAQRGRADRSRAAAGRARDGRLRASPHAQRRPLGAPRASSRHRR